MNQATASGLSARLRDVIDPRVGDLQLMVRVLFARLDFFARENAAGDRVDAAHVLGHIAVGNALHLEMMQAAEFRDLREGQRGVVEQPDRGGAGHQNVGHRYSPEFVFAA